MPKKGEVVSNAEATSAQNATSGEAVVVKWDEGWSIQEAGRVHSLLAGALSEGSSVCIDLEDAERVDTATLQLLCAARADAVSRGIDWQWKGSSAAFDKAVDQLGLGSALGVGRK